MWTAADQLAQDAQLAIFNTCEFGRLADYQSRSEGTKRDITVVKEEIEGGVTDKTHVKQNVRFSKFHIMESLELGVMQPAEGDTVTICEGGISVVWTLAKGGIVSRQRGVHTLKFTTITQIKQGFQTPNNT